MITDDLSNALSVREKAAAEIMANAHALSQSIALFESASALVLSEIPAVALSVGERAAAQKAARFAGDPSDGPREDNQRRHAAEGAGIGARAAIEHRMCQAVTNNFRGGRPQETLGCEMTTEAGVFLRAAAEVAASRAPETQPDNRFVAIVAAQHARLRALTEEISR